MVRGIPIHGIGREASRRSAHVDTTVDRAFQRTQSYNIPPNAAAIAALEACIATLSGDGEAPVDFALIICQGSHLSNFTSQGLQHVESKIFSAEFKNDLLGSLRRPSRLVDSSEPYYREDRRQSYSSDSSSSRTHPRRLQRQQRAYDSNESTPGRKRHRSNAEAGEDDTPVPPQITNQKSLVIGDTNEVTQYYTQRFKDLQQTACKVIAKAFIKKIEPKKQTNHPYTRGSESAPAWWPQMPPPGYKGAHPNFTRHKEPDHLLKDERVKLCVHILRVVLDRDPNRPQNVQAVTIKDLEIVTKDAMERDFFSDKDGKLAAKSPDKRPFFRACLKEIFIVAKQEERYKDGCLDSDATINVMHGDGSMNSDDEEEDEGLKYLHEDGDEPQGLHTPESISPEAGHNQSSTPSRLMEPDYKSDYSLPLHNNRFISMEEPRYQENGMTHIQQQQSFVSNGYQHAPGVQDQDPRRSPWSSTFSSPPNSYNTWSNPQNNMVTTSSMGFAPYNPAHASNPSHFNLPPPPQMHPMQYHDRLRTGSLGHPHHLPQQGFPEFIHDGLTQGPLDAEIKADHHGLQ